MYEFHSYLKKINILFFVRQKFSQIFNIQVLSLKYFHGLYFCDFKNFNNIIVKITALETKYGEKNIEEDTKSVYRTSVFKKTQWCRKKFKRSILLAKKVNEL